MDDAAHAVTRDELLAGLSGRRASMVQYAVETRTAQLALEARHATVPAICEGMAVTRERAFMSALAAGRRLTSAPSIQDLERFASAWVHLVPADHATRAHLADRLGVQHHFRARDVPRIRAALGLDDPAVQRTFESRHGRPLDSVYDTALPRRDRWRWLSARLATRLENLPPFWSVFSLTLTQTLGAGVLALPIALAGVGPLPGFVLLVLLGLVNTLTAVAVAESFARTGSVRWGGAYFGRVVTQHLGPAAGVALSAALVGLSVVALLAYYVGLSTTLAVGTGTPTAAWAAVLFAVTQAFVWRGRLESTVVSALLVGAVNLLVIAALSGLALAHTEVSNLTFSAVPFVGGRAFDPQILGLVFGVVLLAFFGHTAVANGARAVLRRDPTGRALVGGTAAAMTTALALYSVWSIAVGSAVAPSRLAAESGTALTPLAEVAGPAVLVMGSVFVVLAMGMAAVHFSLGLHHQITELLPSTGRGARLGGYAALTVVFVLVEWMLLTGRESFTGSLGFIGTLAAPLLAGVFPVLLLAATRRRGDYVPVRSSAWLGHPSVLVVVYALFLAGLVAHGAVIWQTPLERAAALATAAAVTAVSLQVARSGAFVPLATIEIRRDRELGRQRLRITANGRPVQVRAVIDEPRGRHEILVDGAVDLPERTTSVAVELDALDARQLSVWTHEVDLSGATAPLPASGSLRDSTGTTVLDLREGRATTTLHPPHPVLELELRAGGELPGSGL